jgi:hypothetical protein
MAKAAVQETVIGAVIRQRREELRVSVRHANSRKMLDIRVWVEDELGRMIPTGRGVSLSPTEYTELRKVLATLRRKDGKPEAATSGLPRVK